MSTSLRIFALVLITIYFVVIIRLLKKKEICIEIQFAMVFGRIINAYSCNLAKCFSLGSESIRN